MTNIPAAGWYQDPTNPQLMRWWEGTRWSQHTQNIHVYRAAQHRAKAAQYHRNAVTFRYVGLAVCVVAVLIMLAH